MINVKTLLVGTDAEIPLRLRSGEMFPVTGLVGGTKAKPRPLGKLGAGFTVQEDNVNLEFNIPPAKDINSFNNYILKAVRQLERELPPTVELCFGMAAAEYHPKFLEIPACSQFGCNPDYNVWTGDENPRPKSDNPNLRTASAHIHVGWENPNNTDREELVKWLDVFLGLRFHRLDNVQRREMYGRAGSYRPKEYGIEYRVLGNFWIPDWIPSVYTGVVEAVRALNSGARVSDKEGEILLHDLSRKELSREGQELGIRYGAF